MFVLCYCVISDINSISRTSVTELACLMSRILHIKFQTRAFKTVSEVVTDVSQLQNYYIPERTSRRWHIKCCESTNADCGDS